MLPCHCCDIHGTCRCKDVGRFKVIVWREAEGDGAIFKTEFTSQLVYLNYLRIYLPITYLLHIVVTVVPRK